jgi:hypothetical protein
LHYTPDMESVEREISLPASREEAWGIVTDLEQWFDQRVEGEVALGEVFRLGGRRAVIERFDAPERLTFRWLGEDPSRVDITLEPHGDGTLVRITETRIEPAVTPRPEIGFARRGSAVGGPLR